MEDRERVMDLVRKLMALTESPNEHEAARAAEKVQELLFKHKLSKAEVLASKGEGDGPSIIELDGDITSQKNWGRWKPTLAWAVARYNFCTGFQDTYAGKFVFIGQETEAYVAKELYEWLVIQIEEAARKACLNYRGPSRIPTYRRSFFTGATMTIQSRLYNQWKGLQGQSDQSMALVVHSSALIEDYKTKQYPNLIKGRHVSMANGSYSGYTDGVKAGRDMEITVRRKVEEGGKRLLE